MHSASALNPRIQDQNSVAGMPLLAGRIVCPGIQCGIDWLLMLESGGNPGCCSGACPGDRTRDGKPRIHGPGTGIYSDI